MERLVVVGTCGSGKSTLARALEARWGLPRLELDAIHHLAGWRERPEAEARPMIEGFLDRHERWVVDGNYTRYRDVVWGRADTIVWLDLGRMTTVASLARRTLRRLVTREELWNGNRERWRDQLSLDPERSILLWGWARYGHYRAEYAQLMAGREWPGLRWLRLRSRGEVEGFLRGGPLSPRGDQPP